MLLFFSKRHILRQTCAFQPHFYANPKIHLRRHVCSVCGVSHVWLQLMLVLRTRYNMNCLLLGKYLYTRLGIVIVHHSNFKPQHCFFFSFYIFKYPTFCFYLNIMNWWKTITKLILVPALFSSLFGTMPILNIKHISYPINYKHYFMLLDYHLSKVWSWWASEIEILRIHDFLRYVIFPLFFLYGRSSHILTLL